MSGPTYDSAAWRRCVIGMPDLTPVRKLVLLALETFADYRDGSNAHPGIEALAAMCNLTARAVRDALNSGRDLGLIERTELANRRRGKSDVYRLLSTGTVIPPEVRSTGTAVPPESSVWGNRHVDSGGTATSILGEPPFPPPTQAPTQAPRGESPEPGTAPAAAAPDSNAPSPNPSANGEPATPDPDPFDYPDNDPDGAPADDDPPTADELTAAAELPPPPMHGPQAFPEPEPSRYCPQHPRGTSDKCRDCGDARKRHAGWDHRRRAFTAALRPARDAWIAACRECEDHDADGRCGGWVRDPWDELPAPVRCSHPRLVRAYAARHPESIFTIPTRAAS